MSDHRIENPPAFPVAEQRDQDGCGIREGSDGVTLRDWFAGQALSGLLASGKWDNCGVGFEFYIAGHANNIADAMLAERSKGGVTSNLYDALSTTPIMGEGESVEAFRARQQEWLRDAAEPALAEVSVA